MKVVVLIGAPGAGKSTVAKKIVENFAFVHISTGDLVREKLEKDEKFRKKYEKVLSQGKLLDDETIKKILMEKLEEIRGESVLIDGYPRTLKQAKDLEEIASKFGLEEIKVIYIKIPKEIAIKRLSSRFYCPKCGAIYNLLTKKPKEDMICDICKTKLARRADDEPKAIAKRFEEFLEKTRPLLEYYKSLGILSEIDGNCTIEECYRRVANEI